MEPQPDPPSIPAEVARFHESIGELRGGDALVGYVATTVDAGWRRRGLWWRKRWVGPEVWIGYYACEPNHRPIEEGVVAAGEGADGLHQWASGRFESAGRSLAVCWLEGAERAAAWETYAEGNV